MDNATLTEAVRAELCRIGPLPELVAEMADGIVTLSGSVSDADLPRHIEQRLLALPEVLDVHNYLDVVPAGNGLEAELHTLLQREAVEAEGLRVAADRGTITLSGRAASWFDRDAVGRLAWTLPGVRQVVNQVTLPPGAVEPDRDANGDPIP